MFDEQLAEENKNLKDAGDELALAGARVSAHYDGVHRLRAALAKWFELRSQRTPPAPSSDKEQKL